jgi:hypothetical protein
MMRLCARAFAVMEYLVLIIMIIMALTVFRFYIQHGMQGQMMRTGESYGFGRLFDHSDTLVCQYDDKLKLWYSEVCYQHDIRVNDCVRMQPSSINDDPSRRCFDAVKARCQAGCTQP